MNYCEKTKNYLKNGSYLNNYYNVCKLMVDAQDSGKGTKYGNNFVMEFCNDNRIY